MTINNSVEMINPNATRPSENVLDLHQYLATTAASGQTVLDYGCATGRNSRYLADHGHSVVGMSLILEEVSQAAVFNAGERARFVVGDVRKPPFQSKFDAVVCNEVLHLMPKPDSVKALQMARLLTKPLGFNAVSGYLVTPDIRDEKNIAQALKPHELLQSYLNVGWKIYDYKERTKPAASINGKEFLASTASIIARAPK